MGKTITVSYSINGEATPIPLTYKIELAGNIQTIACCIDLKNAPRWLQIRKFDMNSLKDKNAYTPLFNDATNDKNRDTVLFIDQVYAEIMGVEKMVVKP